MTKGNRGGKRGSGGGSSSASPKTYQSDMVHNAFADSMYDIPKTMAFPSNDRIINTVPELKAMKDNLNNAQIGDKVAFYTGDRYADATVFEKVGEKTWLMTDLNKTDDGVTTFSSGKYQGKKLLQLFSDRHFKAWTSTKDKFGSEYEEAYKKSKKK